MKYEIQTSARVTLKSCYSYKCGEMTSMESPHVSVRNFESGDAALLREIVESAYAIYVARIGKRPEPMDLDYQQVALEQEILIACVNGIPAGFVAYTVENSVGQILLHNLAMDPAHQGMGLGSLLLDSAETLGKAAGMTYSQLYTNALMVENLMFYENRGYEVLYRRTVRGYDRIFLRKKL